MSPGRRVIRVIDSHTGGEPTRVIIDAGLDPLPKWNQESLAERLAALRDDHDDLRRICMNEPRGGDVWVGAYLCPPADPSCRFGVIFFNNVGYLGMCGHGTIGVCTVMVETGMVEVVEPVTVIHLDTPAGLVTGEVEVVDGTARAVTITNVPSFLYASGVEVAVGGEVGDVTLDVAFGGNFYAILPVEDVGLTLDVVHAPDLITRGMALVRAVDRQVQAEHPEDPRIRGIDHVLLTAPGGEDVSARAATVISPGWIDRSPCGTGTSARMAQLHAQGSLGLDEPFVHASLIDSRFTGRLVSTTQVGDYQAVVPTIRGRAWVTGLNQYVLDPLDPYPAGFVMPTVATP